MDYIFFISLGIIFVFVLYLIYHYIKINSEASTISGILFSFGLYICVIPTIVYISGNSKLLNESFKYFNIEIDTFINSIIAILIFLFFYVYSYNFKIRQSGNINYNKLKLYSKRLALFSFYVGLISFLLYAHSFGGIINLIIYAEYMRSFATDKADLFTNGLYIFVVPARLITVAPFLFILYRNFTRNKFRNTIYITCSLIFSVLFLLSDAGKTGIIIYFLSFFVPFIGLKYKHKWMITIALGIIGITIINYLDSLFVYLATGEFELNSEDSMESLAQFSYPINNILNLNKITSLHGYRWGQDFITGALNIIPGINFEPSYFVTSEYYGGPDWKISGGVPNDVITFGYLQFGYLGIIIESIILGRVCNYLDKSLRNIPNTYIYNVIKCTLVILYFQLFIQGDVIAIVRSKFILIFLTITILLSSNYKKTKLC